MLFNFNDLLSFDLLLNDCILFNLLLFVAVNLILPLLLNIFFTFKDSDAITFMQLFILFTILYFLNEKFVETPFIFLKYISIYLLISSIYAFIITTFDKYIAIYNAHSSKGHRRMRISEAKLLRQALLGGAVGTVLSMKIFRHKISKPSFYKRAYSILTIYICVYIIIIISYF